MSNNSNIIVCIICFIFSPRGTVAGHHLLSFQVEQFAGPLHVLPPHSFSLGQLLQPAKLKNTK